MVGARKRLPHRNATLCTSMRTDAFVRQARDLNSFTAHTAGSPVLRQRWRPGGTRCGRRIQNQVGTLRRRSYATRRIGELPPRSCPQVNAIAAATTGRVFDRSTTSRIIRNGYARTSDRSAKPWPCQPFPSRRPAPRAESRQFEPRPAVRTRLAPTGTDARVPLPMPLARAL